MKFWLFAAVTFAALPAAAGEHAGEIPPPNPTAERTAAEPEQEAEPDIVPVLKLKPAPFTGLLVPEGRFTKLLEAELKLDTTEQKLQAQIRFTDSLENMYKKKLEEAAQGPEWYEEPSFNRWLGFTIGVVVTGLVVWGGVEIVKATGNGT